MSIKETLETQRLSSDFNTIGTFSSTLIKAVLKIVEFNGVGTGIQLKCRLTLDVLCYRVICLVIFGGSV